jgi:hypothetical protein
MNCAINAAFHFKIKLFRRLRHCMGWRVKWTAALNNWNYVNVNANNSKELLVKNRVLTSNFFLTHANIPIFLGIPINDVNYLLWLIWEYSQVFVNFPENVLMPITVNH